MKVAIVGGGHIASIHAPCIAKQPGNEVVAIVDKDLLHARLLGEPFGVKGYYQDIQEMLKEQNPDAVHVLTPPQYHAELAIAAMEHGCHVYVEKPLALNMDEARKMVEVAERKNVKLCAGHNMVFESTVQKAVKFVSEGNIGDVVSVEVDLVFDPRRAQAFVEDGAEGSHWLYRLNGGPLQDLMPHPVSLALEFMDEVKDVSQFSHSCGSILAGYPDDISVMLKNDRQLGFIRISLNEKPDTTILTVKGTRGRVRADLFSGIMTREVKSALPRAGVRGLLGFKLGKQYRRGAWANVFKVLLGKMDKTNGLESIISGFYESIRCSSRLPITLDKALASVDIIDRIWPEPAIKSVTQESTRKSTADPNKPLVLVTGGTGFIGISVVKKLLADRYRVRTLVRPNSMHGGRLKDLDVEVIHGSLDDAEVVDKAVAGVDMIYHLGAAMTNSMEEQKKVTLGGTENIIDAALKYNVKSMVQVSTLAVYELLTLSPNSLINEESPYMLKPEKMGAYSYAKIEAEKLVLDAVKNKHLPASIVRLGIVIGPMCRVFYPHMGFQLTDELLLPVGKGDTVLPFIYIDNVVDGIIKAGTCEKAVGRIYNLVDEGNVSVRQYLEKFIEVTGIPAKIRPLPYIIPWGLMLAYEIAAGLGLVKKGVTSRAQLKWKQARMRYDTSKAQQDLGWKTTVPLEEGMKRTFKWYVDKFGSKRSA